MFLLIPKGTNLSKLYHNERTSREHLRKYRGMAGELWARGKVNGQVREECGENCGTISVGLWRDFGFYLHDINVDINSNDRRDWSRGVICPLVAAQGKESRWSPKITESLWGMAVMAGTRVVEGEVVRHS
jgi:hypothetical protein